MSKELVKNMHQFDCVAAAYRDARASYTKALDTAKRADAAVKDAANSLSAAKAAFDTYCQEAVQ